VEQGLGRDAPDVEAGASEFVLLDQGDSEAQLGSAKGGSVSATSATEDYNVKVLFGHPATPCGSDSA
jgi:hypothetical protein